jgi:hypothetical protein
MNKHMVLHVTVLTICIALLTTSIPLSGQGSLTCPQIAPNMRPALLLVEGKTYEESRLWVACEYGGELHRESIISGNRLEATQIDNAVFLVSISQSPYIGSTGSTYVLDLNFGTIRRISETPSIRCLRAEPSRKTAMLIDSIRMPREDRLTELGLMSLATTERQVLSRKLLGDEYSRITHPFKISPDFLHIAYIGNKGEFGAGHADDFELKSLDLKTLKNEVLDSKVRVDIPGISSFSHGNPPFEWISNTQVLYQHMVTQDGFNALCAFKIVDIRTKEISERFRKQLRMELDGGYLETDPLTGRLILNHKYVLDYAQNQIFDRILPFTVISDPLQKGTEIRSADEVLYSGSAMCIGTWQSASGSAFAYVLTPSYGAAAAEVYAVFDRDLKPLRVTEGYSSLIHPIGWIQ